MIYPTPRAVLLAAAGGPVALAASALSPDLWTVGLGWLVFAAGAVLVDVALASPAGGMRLSAATPRVMGVGCESEARLTAEFDTSPPNKVQFALGVGPPVVVAVRRPEALLDGRRAEAPVELKANRRGRSVVDAVWTRWTGPLGLAWIQRRDRLDDEIVVVANTAGVAREALRLFARDNPAGAKIQQETGEGAEFHALREFQTGMEPRTIDWKQSARHLKLLAREHRAERNNQIVLAVDSGRLMSAPLGDASRLDRAVSAALLMAFVSLKLGDRVGFFAFDSQPRISAAPASGMAAYPLIQKLAAGVGYSTEETNFTLGLATLSGQLAHRALVVVFSDFADPTNAELMLENVERLARTHLVLFLVFRDEELEALTAREPVEPEDVSRAVVAAALLRQRELAVERLRRLGVQVVEARASEAGPQLVNRYLDVKRRAML